MSRVRHSTFFSHMIHTIQEFLQSLLKDGEEDSDCVELPKILISVWRNIIETIDHKIGARHLVDCLVDKIGKY